MWRSPIKIIFTSMSIGSGFSAEVPNGKNISSG